MIKGFNHVGFSVRDLNRSIHFYRNLLGMEVVVKESFSGDQYSRILALERAEGTVAFLRSANIQLELFEFFNPSPKPVDPDRPVCDHGLTHFCIEVADIEFEYQRLKSAGVLFHCSPLLFFGNVKATYGRDPDGNVFEMIELGVDVGSG
jgi:catechol 2,3-dioxygenase-like lactoylglutathione lyase family enzyme